MTTRHNIDPASLQNKEDISIKVETSPAKDHTKPWPNQTLLQKSVRYTTLPSSESQASLDEPLQKSIFDIDKRLIIEAFPSLIFAVVGLILAGSLLDKVQHWQVFEQISELIILVPVLLNLKGNLEMNLAARMSTKANLGHLDNNERNDILIGNLLLMQIQGIIVGAVAGCFSFVLGVIVHGTVNSFEETSLMLASGMITASISSLLLGTLMCVIVIISRYLKINPDNISTPLAASLGDLITLTILSGAAFMFKEAKFAFDLTAILIMVAFLPLIFKFVKSNKHVRDLLYEGWSALFISMVISSIAGVILERYIPKYAGMAVLCPVLNGVTGNMGAIFASRISTALHGNLEENHETTMKTLFLMNFPIQILFIGVMAVFDLGHKKLSLVFILCYLSVSSIVLITVLFMTKNLCKWLWKNNMDPHQHVLPYLTATTDVFGTFLLMISFMILDAVNVV